MRESWPTGVLRPWNTLGAQSRFCLPAFARRPLARVAAGVDAEGTEALSAFYREATSRIESALRTGQQMVLFEGARGENFAIPLMMISLIEKISASVAIST